MITVHILDSYLRIRNLIREIVERAQTYISGPSLD